MAAGNKPTAVHFTLIFFVMTTLIAGVMAYLNYGSLNEQITALNGARAEASNLNTAARKRDEEIQQLKRLLGYEYENTGVDAPDANSSLGAGQADLQRLAGPLASNTFRDALAKYRQALDQALQERNQAQTENTDLKARLLAVNSQAQSRIDQFQTQATNAESGLRTNITSKEEALAAKDKEIGELRTTLNQVQQQLEQDNERNAKTIDELRGENKKLIAINDRIRAKVDELTRVSFDRPNGELRWVDYNSKLVWLNLGTADALPIGTTFSVYTKGHHGVGRGAEDVKGSIEVTKIIGVHLAEARILKDDPAQPMAAGDPIFTPLWTSGRKESFAIIGHIDMDGDGQSDRAMLHDKLTEANASFDVEVDDQGNLLGPGMSINTRFLIMADVPDPSTTTPNEKEAAEKTVKHLKELTNQARLLGVRTIRFNDFLNYMGFTAQRRNWRPGEEQPFTLKNGSHSTATNQTIGNRESAGTVSSVYKKTTKVGPAATSSGQTSKLFKGGTGGK